MRAGPKFPLGLFVTSRPQMFKDWLVLFLWFYSKHSDWWSNKRNLNNRRQLSRGFYGSTRFLQAEVWLEKQVGLRPQCHDLFKCVRKPKTVDLIRTPPSQTVRKTGSYMVEPWLVFGQVRNKRKVIVAIKKTRTPCNCYQFPPPSV